MTSKRKAISPSKASSSGENTIKLACSQNRPFPCKDQLDCELAGSHRATQLELKDKGLNDEFLLLGALMSSGSAHISLCRSLLKISEPERVAEHLNALGHSFKIPFDPTTQIFAFFCI